MAVVKNLMLRIGADFSKAKKEMDKATSELKSFKANVSKTMNGIGAALATLGIGAAIRSAVKSAMDVEAAMGQIQRTMGESARSFTEWANAGAKAFNMSRSDALRYGAVYSNLLSGFSADTTETMKRTQDLLKASAVVASSTGRTMEDVMERIRSGLLGNTEAIEDLGINVNIAMIESTAAFRRFAGDKSWTQLDFNTQQAIRYFAILEQSVQKYGESVANNTNSRQQQFIAQLKDIQLFLGQAFLPIYNAVLPALTSMAQALANTMNVLAQFSQALFGSGQSNQTKSVESQAAAVEGLGEAYEAAGKAASGSVAGFDEVNQLSDATGVGGAATAPTTPSTGASTAPLAGLGEASETVSKKIKEMAENIKRYFRELAEQDDVKKLVDAYNSFRDSLKNLGDAFSQFLSNPEVNRFGQWYRDNIVSSFTAIGTSTLETLNSFLLLLKGNLEIITRLLDGDFKGAVKAAWDTLKDIDWERITEFVRLLANPIGYLAEKVGKKLLKFLDDLQYKIPIFGDFKKKVDEVWGELRNTNWSEVKEAIVKSWNKLEEETGKKWDEFKQLLSDKWESAKEFTSWEDIKDTIVNTWTVLQEETGRKWDAFKTYLGEKWTAVKDFTNWNAIKDTVLQKWDEMRTATGQKWDAFKTFVGEKWDAIAELDLSKVGEAIMKAWKEIKTDTGKVWKDIANLIIKSINATIESVNAAIGKINSISVDIPDWVPKYGGERFGLNIPTISYRIPEIPELATGGITNGPMAAIIGDNPGGREVVSPLDDLMDMIQSAVATGVATAAQMAGERSQDIILDGVRLSRETNKYNERERSRIGGSMITVT